MLRRLSDALASYEPSPACGKPLALRVCFPDAVSSAETTAMNTLLGRLPSAHFACSPEQCSTIASQAVASGRALKRDAVLGGEKDKAAVAATTLLQLSSAFAIAGKLLIACVDATDGRTMAAALAARLSGVSLLNVCDLTPTAHDGLAPPASGARSGTELVNEVVGRAVGCA